MDLETHLLETLRSRSEGRGLTHHELRERCGLAWRREFARRTGLDGEEVPLTSVKDFVHRLWQEGRVIIEPPAGAGKAVRVWHPEQASRATGADPSAAPSGTPGIAANRLILEVYHRLSRETRSPYVFLSRLRDECGLPLDPLHRFLRQEQEEGRAVLSSGDWSAASEDERSAVLQIGGRNFIKVRLVQEFQRDDHGTED